MKQNDNFANSNIGILKKDAEQDQKQVPHEAENKETKSVNIQQTDKIQVRDINKHFNENDDIESDEEVEEKELQKLEIDILKNEEKIESEIDRISKEQKKANQNGDSVRTQVWKGFEKGDSDLLHSNFLI